MDVPRSIAVVGGGIAGVSTVAALRQGGYDGELFLIDSGEFPYDRPPLSKDYLAGTRELKQIALKPPEWYEQQSIRLVTETTVTALRPSSGRIETADGVEIRADRVVLAMGGRAVRPPVPGVHGARVHTLRTAPDADRLRLRLVPGAHLLVVGAGLIGAEVASTAVDRGCEVVLVDPLVPPLALAVGTEIAAWLHDQHAQRGITTLQAGLESLADKAGGIEARLTGEAAARRFDLVLLGVGMTPETGLAEAAGLVVGRGVIVDDGLATSNPAILAVGDLARIRSNGVAAPRTEHWEAAVRDGSRAAATILGSTFGEPGAPWFWSDRHHRHVEVVGSMARADVVVLRGEPGAAGFAAFGLREGLVVGVVSVDDATSVRAGRRLIDRRIPVDGDRLSDLDSDLRRLLRN